MCFKLSKHSGHIPKMKGCSEAHDGLCFNPTCITLKSFFHIFICIMARLKRAVSEELDRRIIGALKENGKMTFAELAEKLNVSASTVYNRVTKLEKKGIIKGYTIIVDRSKSGKGTGAALLITVDNQASIEGVCRDLARIPDVESVYEIGGESDIMALVYTASIEEMRKLVNERINSIQGVENVNPLVIMKTYKENGSLF